MSPQLRRPLLVSLALPAILLATGPAGAAVSFTGDVPTDFTDPAAVTIDDPGAVDVGIPHAFPAGTISGNDIAAARFWYDTGADVLYVGIDAYTIAGDVDDDGDPGGTSALLAFLGGVDEADFGGTESFALMLDVDEDGVFDVIAGVSGDDDLSGFAVAEFAGSPYAPAYAFGPALAAHTGSVFGSPDAAAPDVEFTVASFSTLPVSSGSDPSPGFGVNVFAGSFSDAGIGEDYLPGVAETVTVCFDSDLDGFTGCDGDCEDTDPGVNPGAAEVCDGDDDDCDGLVDEDFDLDGDGHASCDGVCEPMGIYVVDANERLLRYEPDGSYIVCADGFDGITDVAAGPDMTLYLTDFNAATVYSVEPGCGAVTAIADWWQDGIAQPWSVAVDDAGLVYVADRVQNTVWVIDPGTGSVSVFLDGSDGIVDPVALEIGDDGLIYVAHHAGAWISRFDALGDPVAPSPLLTYAGIGFTETFGMEVVGERIWFTDTDANRVWTCDLATLSCEVIGDGGDGLWNPWDLGVDCEGAVWVSNAAGNTVTVLTADGGSGTFADPAHGITPYWAGPHGILLVDDGGLFAPPAPPPAAAACSASPVRSPPPSALVALAALAAAGLQRRRPAPGAR
ncbi:hypothetical protein L6R50_11960 [Myxococcota bacterium]|nr:hypothetical protein [Myxococcota bacterium]